jgi:uncharacterized membrane protein
MITTPKVEDSGAGDGAKPGRGLSRVVGLAAGALSFLFPLIALLLARPFGALAVVVGLIVVLVLRVATGLGKKAPSELTWAALAGAGLLAAASAINADLAMRIYPVLMSAAMLTAFGLSLARPPSMIERFARIMEPDLPEAGVRYTRGVTWVWCGFFIVNGAIGLWTALGASLETWALYNGLISYLLMGALLGGEFLVRGMMRARERQTP